MTTQTNGIQIHGRFLYLLVAILTFLFAFPLLENQGVVADIVLPLLYFTIFIAGMYGITTHHQDHYIALAVAVPTLFASWLNVMYPSLLFSEIVTAIWMIYYFWTIIFALVHIINVRQANSNLLYGAISVYLLFGITFGLLYTIFELVQPATFLVNDPRIAHTLTRSDFIYFSFVTLTTVGYGDIKPVAGFVKPFVSVEAIIGIFYVAMLVARLVHLYHPHAKDSE